MKWSEPHIFLVGGFWPTFNVYASLFCKSIPYICTYVLILSSHTGQIFIWPWCEMILNKWPPNLLPPFNFFLKSKSTFYFFSDLWCPLWTLSFLAMFQVKFHLCYGRVYGAAVRQWNVSLGNLLFHCFTQPANLTRHCICISDILTIHFFTEILFAHSLFFLFLNVNVVLWTKDVGYHGCLHHHNHHHWWSSVGSRRLWGINFSGGKKIGGDWWWKLSS